jgi:uncharacterized protein YuzE
MKIEYDKEADALYIQLKEAFVEDSIEVESGVVVDVDSERHVIGLEVLNASKRLTLSDLTNISIRNIPLKEAA